jgi:hypothetical protein
MTLTERLLREMAEDFSKQGMPAIAVIAKNGADRIAELEREVEILSRAQRQRKTEMLASDLLKLKG